MNGQFPASLPILRELELRELVSVGDAISVVKQAYEDYGRERLVLSQPESMTLVAADTIFKLKGGRSPGQGTVGFRLISQDSQTLLSHCIVMDAHTGAPLGMVDETWLHRLRTAATAAAAAALLARSDARRLAIIGAGRIADEVPAAFREIFALDDIRVASRSPVSAAAFAHRHGITAAKDVDDAVEGADIVVAITSATEPVLQARHITPGMTLLGLGGGAEIDASALDIADRFLVDDFEFASVLGSIAGWIEAGRDRTSLRGRLDADLGEIAAGTRQGRTAPEQRVLAIVQGMAACDVALASFALAKSGRKRS